MIKSVKSINPCSSPPDRMVIRAGVIQTSFDIIKLHKGKISVDSVEGEGTTFHIALPITNPK